MRDENELECASREVIEETAYDTNLCQTTLQRVV